MSAWTSTVRFPEWKFRQEPGDDPPDRDHREHPPVDPRDRLREGALHAALDALDGERRLALEILLNTPLVAQLIHKGEFHKIKEVMKKSDTLGMQTFDQALLKLYENGEISYEDALHHADAPNELRLLVKLGKDGGVDKLQSTLDGMHLINPEKRF